MSHLLQVKVLGLLLFTIGWAHALEAQPFPVDTNSGTHNHQPGSMGIRSFEDTDWDQSTSVPLLFHSEQAQRLKGNLRITDNAWCQLQGPDSLSIDSLMGPEDSLKLWLHLVYDTSYLPFYPKELKLYFEPDSSLPDSLRPTAMSYSIKLYFTPYKSLEVWDVYDYYAAPRVWMEAPESSQSSWSYVPKDSIPLTDIPSDTVFSDTSTFDYQPRYVPGLAYLVPMMPTGLSQGPAQGPRQRRRAEGCGAGRQRYYFEIDHMRISSAHIRDGNYRIDRIEVPIYLKNARVDFFVDRRPVNTRIARLQTDNEGYVVNEQGQRRFVLNFCASSSGDPKTVYPVVKLHYPGDMNKLRLKYAGAQNNYASFGSHGQTVSGSQSSPSSFNPFYPDTEWQLPGTEHPAKTYSFIGWGYELTQNELQGSGQALQGNLAIKIERWDHLMGDNNYYFSLSKTLHFQSNRLHDEATHFHELGHYVFDELHSYTNKSSGGHTNSENNRTFEQTLSEGFADGYSYIMDEMTYAHLDFESGFDVPRTNIAFHFRRPLTNDLNSPYLAEDYFARVLLDLWDGAQNLQAFNVPYKPIAADYGNDTIELSLPQLLQPFWEYEGTMRNIVQYYEQLMGQLSNCADIQAYKAVWDYNMSEVDPALDVSTFQFLNSDRIKGTAQDYEYIPVRRRDGNSTLLDPISLSYAPNVNLVDQQWGSFNHAHNGCITDELLLEGGDLYINNSGYGADWLNDPIANPNLPHVEVEVHNYLYIGTNQKLEIGDANRTATLSTHDNVVVDGDIIIHEGSRLIVGEGTELRCYGGQPIQLLGDNAVLEIRGSLVMFAYTNLEITGTGKVILNSNTAECLKLNDGCELILEGSGPNNVVLEIRQPDVYLLSNQGGGSSKDFKVSISNGKVLMANDSRLCMDNEIVLDEVVFDRLNPSDEPRGIYLYGQPDALLSHCSFNHLRYGIYSANYKGHKVELIDCDFNHCTYGVFQSRHSAEIIGCNFNQCQTAWYARGASLPGYMAAGSIHHCGQGISFFGNTNLHLNSPNIYDNSTTGVDFYGRSFSSWCGNIANNHTGLQGVFQELLLSPKFKPYSGYMDFSDNRYGINMQGKYLRLNWGKNDLVSLLPLYGTNLDINAQHVAWYAAHSGIVHISQVLASDNKWDNKAADNFPQYQTLAGPAPYGNQYINSLDPFGGLPTPTLVKSYQEINSRPACPVVFDPIDPNFVNGFVDAESEFHNPEHGTPMLDMVPLVGHSNHEFQNTPLQQAVQTTVTDLYTETLNNRYTQATERFALILRAVDNELWEYAPDPYIDYVVDYAYLRMMEAFEYACLYEGALDNGSTLLADQVIAAQQDLIAMVEAETDPAAYTYTTRFVYNMDLATTQWLIEDHGSATTTLSNMQLWTNGHELSITNSTLCRINYEHDVLQGTIALTDVGSAPYPCQESFVPPAIVDPEVTSSPEAIEAHAFELVVFPNPADGELKVQFSNSMPAQCSMRIYNTQGKLVWQSSLLEKEGFGGFSIPTSSLSNGVYYLKAHTAQGISSTSFSVQH